MTRPALKTTFETLMLAGALVAGAVFAAMTMPTLKSSEPASKPTSILGATYEMGIEVDMTRLTAVSTIC